MADLKPGEVRFGKPNKAFDAILTGRTGRLRSVLNVTGREVRDLYRSIVGVDTGNLKKSARVVPPVVMKVAKGEPRLVGKVTIGGMRVGGNPATRRNPRKYSGYPSGWWFNEDKNPNPGFEFFYAAYHEFGTKTSGGGAELTAKQKRRIQGLRALAADSAASPSERKLAASRADEIEAKAKGGGDRQVIKRGAHDLEKVVKMMAAKH